MAYVIITNKAQYSELINYCKIKCRILIKLESAGQSNTMICRLLFFVTFLFCDIKLLPCWN